MRPVTLRDAQIRQAGRMTGKDLIFSAVILLLLLLIVPLLSEDDGDQDLLVWGSDRLELTFPDGTRYIIPYDRVTGIRLIENPDFGACISGEHSESHRCGHWENEEPGAYIACVYRSFDTVIQIDTADQIYWIGYDSSDSTRLLYQGFLELLGRSPE